MSTPRRLRAALAAAAVLVVAACSAIPTQGAVQKGDARVPEGDPVVVVAEGPAPNADPVSIVEGFLLAGSAGLSGDFVDFVAAREFLTPDARSSWDPLGSVVVASATQVQRTSDTQVTVEVQVAGKVDADGRYTEASADGRESVTFDMVQDSRQQWRIGGTPKGLILSQGAFASRFRAAQLYFLSPDSQVLVPETRWYPSRNLPTSVVKGLLSGPSPWLRDAVRTAVPDGVQLKPEAVTVDADGVAEVDLDPARTVQTADRGLLLAQLQQSLQLPQVRSVVVRAGATGVPLDGATSVPTPAVGDPVMIQGDALVSLVNGALQPVAGVGSLAGLDARSAARSADGSVQVLLSGTDRLVLAPTATAPARVLISGAGLAAPSVDRRGWIWTATGGSVLAVTPAGSQVTLTAPWLVGRSVKALAVARDGTRVAVVSDGPDGVAIDVAGVVRDASGAPQQLSTPVRAGASVADARQVVWADAVTLGVLGGAGGPSTLRLVPVGGQSEPLPDVADAASIASGVGERSMLVATHAGELLRYDGRTWVPVQGATGVRDPAYPG
ncbi:MAG: GerMN domain-containing protein [Cellulomonas sp.]|nr:GerMN domain-containing protein [Cellulomonas sp.]